MVSKGTGCKVLCIVSGRSRKDEEHQLLLVGKIMNILLFRSWSSSGLTKSQMVMSKILHKSKAGWGWVQKL